MQENEKGFPQILAEQQDVAFNARMRQFNQIGELTNWRTNMKDNTRRTKILVGYNKLMGICFGKV
tara:strand:+ start:1267 stop:1461 length:195 start_codon:yes stop_codon:yes gene_type:complete